MKSKYEYGFFLLVFLLPICLLSSCTSSPPDSSTTKSAVETTTAELSESSLPQYGGTLIICDMSPVSVLGYPPHMTSGSPIRLSAPALETLFRLNSNLEITPYLAAGYESNREQNQITIRLREDVWFHDYTVMDANAVKWNLEQQMKAEATGTGNIDTIHVIDDFTLLIQLKQWDNTLLVSLCQSTGLIISPSAFEAHNDTNQGAEWASSHPVGTGAFSFESMDSAKTIVYRRFDLYWQEGKPYLDSIVITFNSDSSSREFKLRNGDYDVLIRGDIASLASFSADGYHLNTIDASSGPWGLVFDSANGDSPFHDSKVRQAICYAIDPAWIAQNVYLNTVSLTNQYSIFGEPSYNNDVVGYHYDVQKAKALLTEAGYPNGFTTTYTYDQKADNAEALGYALKDMLKQIDVSLELRPVSNTEHTSMLLKGGGWEGIIGIFGSAQADTLTQMYDYLIGEQKYLSMYKPAGLTEAIQAAVSASPGEFLPYVHRAQKIIVDEYCLIYCMFTNKDISVLAPNVHDTGLSQMRILTQWNPADTWITPPTNSQ